MRKLVALDLFSGAGGLSFGLKSAGIDVAMANEFNSVFCDTYAANHPSTKLLRSDVRELNFRDEIRNIGLESVDLVCGGPPCQGFSTVGKKDFHDDRNSLFREFLRAVRETSPSFVVFENVSGFMTMYGGFAYSALTSELGAMGYNLSSSVLDIADYGLPQRRKRTIVLGCRDSVCGIPTPTHGKHLTIMDAIGDMPPLAPGESSDKYLCAPQNEYQSEMRIGTPGLTEHNASEYGAKMVEILASIPAGGSLSDLPAHLRPNSAFANTYARLFPDKPSPTITRNFGTPSSSRCVHPYGNRALSTREGARLQGFPDRYIFCGGKTSKNLQIGNSVPPILGRVIGEAITSHCSV